jgi:hypothetical protein
MCREGEVCPANMTGVHVANFLANLVAGLIAYTYQETKPSLHIRMPDAQALPVVVL